MEQKTLFSKDSLHEYLSNLKEEIRITVSNFSEKEINDGNIEFKISKLVTGKILKTPILFKEKITSEMEDAELDGNPYTSASLSRGKVKGKRIKLYVQFLGDSKLFVFRPSQFTSVHPNGSISDNELLLSFEYSLHEDIATKTKEDLAKELSNIDRYLGWVKLEVEQYNASLGSFINQLMASKRQNIERDKKMINDLGFKPRGKE